MATQWETKGTKSYRISKGAIRLGRDDEEVLDTLEGILTRVGYHEEEYDGEKKAYVEADMENAEGETIRLKARVSLDGTGSQITPAGFALGLLGCKLHDDISVKPQLGKPYGKNQTQSTFVDVGAVNPASGKYRKVGKDQNDYPGANSREKWSAILADLRKHECYADRPVFDKDDESGEATDLSIFSKIDTDKRWPSPFGAAKGTYLQGLSDMAGIAGVYDDFAEVPQNVINDFATAYEGSTFDDVPENLQPFLEKAAKPAFGKKAS